MHLLKASRPKPRGNHWAQTWQIKKHTGRQEREEDEERIHPMRLFIHPARYGAGLSSLIISLRIARYVWAGSMSLNLIFPLDSATSRSIRWRLGRLAPRLICGIKVGLLPALINRRSASSIPYNKIYEFMFMPNSIEQNALHSQEQNAKTIFIEQNALNLRKGAGDKTSSLLSVSFLMFIGLARETPSFREGRKSTCFLKFNQSG